jgi:hypothetical protein
MGKASGVSVSLSSAWIGKIRTFWRKILMFMDLEDVKNSRRVNRPSHVRDIDDLMPRL